MAIADISTIPDTPLDILELRHRRRESAMSQLVEAAAQRGVIRHPDVVLASLARRERLGTTGLGRGVAVPTLHSLLVRRAYLLVGRSQRGLEWGAPDGEDVALVAFVLTPGEMGVDRHLQRVTSLVHHLRLQRNRQRLLAAVDQAALAMLLNEVTA